MAKKRKLSELISEETKQTELSESVTVEPANSGARQATESVSNKVTKPQTNEESDLQTKKITNSESSELTDLQTNEVPKYLTLVRKEARLREDQLDNLTSLTRALNRKRRGTGERITENTLIRIAVDLLLNKSDELKGFTEQELKKSVSL